MTVHSVPPHNIPSGAAPSPPAPGPAAPGPVAGTEIPAPSIAEVERSRLDSVFHLLRAGEVRSVCLWAAAGSGKTTLLAAWARRLRREGESVTWLRAPELGRFRADEFWRQTEGGAFPLGVPGDGATRYVFIDDLDLRGTDRAGLLGALVASAPAGIRLVVAGRTRPGAGLTHLRAAGSIVEVQAAALAFDRSELLTLAAGHRFLLTEEETSILLQRTAGWVTALALVLPLLRGRDDASSLLRGFNGDDPAVADFLRSEVIACWNDGDESTMLRVAVRAVVSVDLAVAVTNRPDAGAVLDRLAGPGALIVRGSGDTGGYRIHPILLAYLQAEAWRRDAVAAAAAHETAARWFASRADGHNAVEQALAARLPGLVAEMLDAFGVDLVLRGTPELVRQALFGSGALAGNPRSPVAATLRLLLDAPYFPDRGLARHLLAKIAAAGPRPGNRAHTHGVVVDALTAFFAATDDEIRHGLSGMSAARNAPGCRENQGVALLAATAEAWCLAELGEAEQAEVGLRAVAVTALNAGYTWLCLLAGDLAATSASRRGDWVTAGVIDDQLALATDAFTRPAGEAGAFVAGASVAGAPFDRAVARNWVSLQIRRYEACEPVDSRTLERLVTADPLVSDAGLVVPAQALLALSAPAAEPKPRSVLERLNGLMRGNAVAHPRVLSLCCIRWFDLTGALDGKAEARRVTHLVQAVLGADSLEAVLLRSLSYPTDRGRLGRAGRLHAAATMGARCWRGSTLVSAWIVLAGIAQESGQPAEADALLVRALRLAEQLRVERAFLAVGGLGVSLLDNRLGRLADLDGFANRILTLAGQSPGRSPGQALPASVAPLTEREREMLRELPFHQSVADIARKHNVSPNTVKTHLRNIYQKLEATDRARAVVIAHERGLL